MLKTTILLCFLTAGLAHAAHTDNELEFKSGNKKDTGKQGALAPPPKLPKPEFLKARCEELKDKCHLVRHDDKTSEAPPIVVTRFLFNTGDLPAHMSESTEKSSEHSREVIDEKTSSGGFSLGNIFQIGAQFEDSHTTEEKWSEKKAAATADTRDIDDGCVALAVAKIPAYTANYHFKFDELVGEGDYTKKEWNEVPFGLIEPNPHEKAKPPQVNFRSITDEEYSQLDNFDTPKDWQEDAVKAFQAGKIARDPCTAKGRREIQHGKTLKSPSRSLAAGTDSVGAPETTEDMDAVQPPVRSTDSDLISDQPEVPRGSSTQSPDRRARKSKAGVRSPRRTGGVRSVPRERAPGMNESLSAG